MKFSVQKPFDGTSASSGFPASGEFEATLRLIAQLPAPEGLAERVQAGLQAGSVAASGRARILRWPVALRLENSLNADWLRAAAAAAIVFVVVGGGWGVFLSVRPVQPARGIVPPHVAPSGGFSSAGAMRTPQTLNGPMVAHPATVAPQPAKNSTTAPAARKPVHRQASSPNKATTAPAAAQAK